MDKDKVQWENINNPLLAHYWNTEKTAQSWIRSHVANAKQSSSGRFSGAPSRFPPPPPPPPLPPLLISRVLLRSWKKKTKKRRRVTKVTAISEVVPAPETHDLTISINAEEPQLQLSADVLAFMAQTIRHRIEREKKKADAQEIEDQTVVYVPADRPFGASAFKEFGGDASAVAEMLLGKSGEETASTASERRRQELVLLYGEEAADRIHAEETLMQMKFDQEYDKHHPPFWPNIPLKF